MSSPDYDTRAKEYGFAPKEVLLKTVQQSNVVLLDVRRPEEIEETGSFQLPNQQSWVNSSCTPTACPELEAKAEELLPDKNAPIVIYCKSGRRASKAEEVLKSKGYTTVLNAGGITDLDYLKKD